MNLDEHQKQFIKIVERMSNGKSNVFRDWCEVTALSLANGLQLKNAEWDAREKRYLEIVKAYDREELNGFAEMLALVATSLTDGDGFNFHDCLGELHMTNEITGRSSWDSDVAFTPREVALMMVKMTLDGMAMPAKGYITIQEPACGAGTMIIATCAVMKELGLNFQQQLHVTAVEIRSMIAHMAYIQFSLLHIPATVIHGDSLAIKTWSVWKTPAHVIGLWDVRLRRDLAASQLEPESSRLLQPIKEVLQLDKAGQASFDFQIQTERNTHANKGTDRTTPKTKSRVARRGAVRTK